jgi:hypothetical protein
MKAYIASAKYENYVTIVFAETAGQARSIAMHTDACCDAEFTDIEVRRYPKADSQYDGGSEMDWENPKHRLFLVSECGFSCVDPDYRFCKSCVAKEKCDTYQEYLAEDGDSDE